MIETPSPLIRKFAAIGLAVALLLAIAGFVIEPAVRRLSDLDEQINAKRESLGLLSAIAARALNSSDAANRGDQIPASEVFLPGETEPIRLAYLQASIRLMSEEEGVRLRSTRTLSSIQRDEVQLAGLQLTLQAPVAAVQRLLHRIEVHRPILLVDGLDIAPVAAAALSATDDRLLHVELRVLAHVQSPRIGSAP